MKVSVIIPVYNCSRYLDKCLGALLAQTYRDLEILLVDDGSTDDSLKICRRYAQADARVRVLHKEKSEGAGPARNSGMDAAGGDGLMFLDADDWAAPDMVEKLTAALEAADSDIAVCGYESFVEGTGDRNNQIVRFDRRILDTPEKTKAFFAEQFPEGIVGYLWNKLYRAAFIREHAIRFPDMRRLQDGVFNIEAFGEARSCCVIEDILYHYRINAQTDLFRKCPKNYYELIRQFSQTFLTEKSKWGQFPDQNILTFFMNELGTCIENTYSPQWNMTAAERKAYFARIAGDDFFRFARQGSYSIGTYRRTLIQLLEENRYSALGAVIRLKIFMKTVCRPVFYLMKRM
ncbi:MAG: glycosyltransferase family 2 protein [Hominenteromicrobium sp.]